MQISVQELAVVFAFSSEQNLFSLTAVKANVLLELVASSAAATQGDPDGNKPWQQQCQ